MCSTLPSLSLTGTGIKTQSLKERSTNRGHLCLFSINPTILFILSHREAGAVLSPLSPLKTEERSGSADLPMTVKFKDLEHVS